MLVTQVLVDTLCSIVSNELDNLSSVNNIESG